ncbi:unnamed protein product [Enterobius vermicularis]|uniref:MEDS domain-containing protein n=1 Tax=Enterobius vermicularis TaxID=51028 RepID=A0A0N4VBN8_ENTVE|nr:unnamed protein product [Enterobius vermicularis]
MKEFFEAEVQPSARLTLYVETSRLIVNEILSLLRIFGEMVTHKWCLVQVCDSIERLSAGKFEQFGDEAFGQWKTSV